MNKKTLISFILSIIFLSILLINNVHAISIPTTIVVHKYLDLNINGVQDAGEQDIEGWEFSIYYDSDPFTLIATGVTSNTGVISFFLPVQEETDFRVWEEGREFWETVTPAGMTPWNDGYFTTVSIGPDTEIVSIDFGNVYNPVPVPEPATILLLSTGLVGLAGLGRKKFLKK